MRPPLLPSAALAAILAQGALAQEAPVELDELVLEALRTGTAESAIPGSVQVVEAEEIARLAAQGQDLAQILGDRVGGLTPANGTSSTASLNLRGRAVQVLVDGVARTSELRGFSRDLALIDPARIERVEIVKGATARFGNGATGGIINIVTKRPEDGERSFASVRISAQDDDPSDTFGIRTTLSHERRIGDTGLRFDLAGETMGDRVDGAGRLIPSDPTLGQGGLDNFDSYSLGVGVDHVAGPHEFGLRIDAARYRQDIDAFQDFAAEPVAVDADSPYTGADPYDESLQISGTWRYSGLAFADVEVLGYYTDVERRSALALPGVANTVYYPALDPAVPFGAPVPVAFLPVDPESQGTLSTETYGAKITFRSGLDALTPGASLAYGFDLGRDRVSQTQLDGDDLFSPLDQTSVAAFVQADVPLGERWDISAGLRAERFDLSADDFTRPDAALIDPAIGFGLAVPALDVTGTDAHYDAVVGNIGAVYHATPSLDLFAGFSQGFSIPDVGGFLRRAGSSNVVPGQTLSFDDLRPEAQIVDNWEIGLRYESGALSFGGSAFYATSDEGTTFDTATSTVSQQKEETYGAEIDAAWRVDPTWQLGLVAAYTEGQYDSDGDGDIDAFLPNNRIVTPFKTTLYTQKAFDNGLTLNGAVTYTSERDKDGMPVIEETLTVDAGGSYALGTGRVTFGVTNLFDRDQYNPTASTVRENVTTGEAIYVADEGRRISLGYEMAF